MNNEHPFSGKQQKSKVEALYNNCQQLKSTLWFMDDEMLFLERLLNSYVFEPNTPNLFERLSGYLEGLKAHKVKKDQLVKALSKHEQFLGGMMECKDKACDDTFYKQHEVLQAELFQCTEDFNKLKSEIFNYAGGILKKRKPSAL